MLYPVRRHPGLRAAHTYKRTLGDVIIHAIHIRISMVNNVVFELPDKTIAPNAFNVRPSRLFDPLAG